MTQTTDHSVRDAALERFSRYVSPEPNSGCWLWIGYSATIRSMTYGKFRLYGKYMNAHRASYMLHYGVITSSKLHVRHKCDNGLCVNPDHLELGSNLDNIRDRDSRGRQKCKSGMEHWCAKLTGDQIVLIRELAKTVPKRALARQFNVHGRTIGRVVDHENWGHVK